MQVTQPLNSQKHITANECDQNAYMQHANSLSTAVSQKIHSHTQSPQRTARPATCITGASTLARELPGWAHNAWRCNRHALPHHCMDITWRLQTRRESLHRCNRCRRVVQLLDKRVTTTCMGWVEAGGPCPHAIHPADQQQGKHQDAAGATLSTPEDTSMLSCYTQTVNTTYEPPLCSVGRGTCAIGSQKLIQMDMTGSWQRTEGCHNRSSTQHPHSIHTASSTQQKVA